MRQYMGSTAGFARGPYGPPLPNLDCATHDRPFHETGSRSWPLLQLGDCVRQQRCPGRFCYMKTPTSKKSNRVSIESTEEYIGRSLHTILLPSCSGSVRNIVVSTPTASADCHTPSAINLSRRKRKGDPKTQEPPWCEP